MIDKKISVSEQVANLGEKGALLFTWMIPHADDIGLLPYSPRTIKALIVPMFDYTVEDIAFHLESMRNQNLIQEFQYGDTTYWRVINFSKEQAGLKKDRQPQTILKIELGEDPKKNWKTLYSMLEDSVSVLVPEVKRSEVKGREDINNGNSNFASPESLKTEESKKDDNSVGAILEKRFTLPQPKTTGISTPWQDKGFRYAEKLQIKLSGELTGRWLKLFKESADDNAKAKKLEMAFSYLIDYSPFLQIQNNEQKFLYFCEIYNHGIKPLSQVQDVTKPAAGRTEPIHSFSVKDKEVDRPSLSSSQVIHAMHPN